MIESEHLYKRITRFIRVCSVWGQFVGVCVSISLMGEHVFSDVYNNLFVFVVV